MKNQWETLAEESSQIAEEVLKREFLPQELYEAYSKKVLKLKLKCVSAPESVQKTLSLIESRLRILNPKHRIQVNFEFFTRKISHYQGRLQVLKEKLATFESSTLTVSQIKQASIQKEIDTLEQELKDALIQRNSLLA